MNILHISQILPIPGIRNDNNYVFILADHIQDQFPTASLYFLRPVPYTNRILSKLQNSSTFIPKGFKEYKYGNYDVITLIFFSAWSQNNLHALFSNSAYWLNRKMIRKLIYQKDISVIHAQFIFPDGLIALLIKKIFNIPYIITTHQELRYFNNFLSRRIAISVLQNAYKVTPLNYRNYNFFKSLGINNIKLIPLGFDNPFLRKPEANRADSNIFRIISICELIKLKNIDKVLNALSVLKTSHNIKYTVIGTGPEMRVLKDLSFKLGVEDYVDFIGYVDNKIIPDILQKHDLFVLPSFPETFGRVYFEAMASGLPVICAKNSGIYGYYPELVDKYSVQPDNSEELINNINYFIENKNQRLEIGKKLQSLVSKYTWENIAKAYKELYAEAADRKQNNC